MEVTLSQVQLCPPNVDLVVFCRLIGAEGSTVTLEDLRMGGSIVADVAGDVVIPEDLYLPVQVEGKVRSDGGVLEVNGISTIENKELLGVLMENKKLNLFERQSLRGLKICKSRLK